MDRTKYWDGMQLGADHLNYTEETKIRAIKRIILTGGLTGPVEGLIVAPDPNDPYKVMISAGKGWTYGGDYVELTNNVYGVSVSNVPGVESYVALKLEEKETLVLPHQITGELRSTRVESEVRVKIFTKSEWDNIFDKSNYMLLAIVRGSGSVVRGIDILRPYSTIVSLMVARKVMWALSGVKIVVISSNTFSGYGRIRWDSSTKKLRWRSPGDAVYGAEVEVGVSGLYTLWNYNSSKYIKVEVDVSSLPSGTVEEDVEVINIFEQDQLSPGTMNDLLHRAMLGSGMPSLRNPHGQTLDDLDPGVHQNMYRHRMFEHSVGIIGAPGSASARVDIYTSNTVRIVPLIGGEKLVSGGRIYDQLATSYISFSGRSPSRYVIYVGDAGIVQVASQVPDGYMALASVYWNGSTLSELQDLRVWGNLDPDSMIWAGEEMLYDPNAVSYVLGHSIGKLRWMIKAIVGGNTWKTLPKYTLEYVGSWLESLQRRVDELDVILARHVSATTRDYVHGIVEGHGGNFNADMVDGCHAQDLITNMADLLRMGQFSGVNADMLDGWHWDQIKDYVDNKVQSNVVQMEIIGAPMRLHDQDHTSQCLRLIIAGNEWFVPVAESACPCTCTCTCTAPCSCTGPCGCRSTCSICHLKV